MAANDRQEGGAHYKGVPMEHWDFVLMHNIPYLEAQIIKYVMRHKKKNGMEDLRKAKHFLEKLIEHELNQEIEADPRRKPEPTSEERLRQAREVIHGSDEDVNKYMSPDSGEPRGQGYVNQD